MSDLQIFCSHGSTEFFFWECGFFFFFGFTGKHVERKMSDSSDSEGQAPHIERKIPNILVTGTPGTGKTTTSELIAEATGLTHVNVGDLVKQKQLHEGYLEEFDTHILDEDKVMQH